MAGTDGDRPPVLDRRDSEAKTRRTSAVVRVRCRFRPSAPPVEFELPAADATHRLVRKRCGR